MQAARRGCPRCLRTSLPSRLYHPNPVSAMDATPTWPMQKALRFPSPQDLELKFSTLLYPLLWIFINLQPLPDILDCDTRLADPPVGTKRTVKAKSS